MNPCKNPSCLNEVPFGGYCSSECEKDEEIESLRREKKARMYYQEIVYHVCNVLDRIYGKKPGHGVVCGTLETPEDETQKVMDGLSHYVDELRSDLESLKECLRFNITCPTCFQDNSDGRVPSELHRAVTDENKDLHSQIAFAKYAENVQCEKCGVEPCMVCSKSDLPAQLLVLTEERDELKKQTLEFAHEADDGCDCEHNKADPGCPVPCVPCQARKFIEEEMRC